MILTGRLLIDPDRPPAPGWIETDGAMIRAVEAGPPPRPADLGDADAILCPGFVDAHVHLPQVDAIGCDGLDLLDWLDAVIFPAEARWGDRAFAVAQARTALRRMLRQGTTGCAAWLSSHPHALDAATEAHADVPLRALLGPALMDRAAPADLLHAAFPPPAGAASPRVTATLNPRFAIACTPDLLAETGRRATAGTVVHTHLAEQVRECTAVHELFPDAPHYAGVYDAAGLLGPRTLLAHGVHLAPAEWVLLAQRGCVVVHCPGANTFLRSGLFDLDAARAHGVRVALGSDVAAGPDIAMPRVARAMIEVAKLRRLSVAPEAYVPTPAEAWRLITEGNAAALGFEDAGRLAPGAAADILVLRPGIPVDEHLVGRLLYTWRDDCVEAVVLNGRIVEIRAD